MLSFFTSLSFLYLFVILLLLLYGVRVYRSITRNGYFPRLFPGLFLLIFLASVSFLYFNMHPSLGRKLFSNLDHHFIQHEGFRSGGRLELGRIDTTVPGDKKYNRFLFTRDSSGLQLYAAYSEEPFYVYSGDKTRLVSKAYPATGKSVNIRCDSITISIIAVTDHKFDLIINGRSAGRSNRTLRYGQDAGSLFRDDSLFQQSGWFGNERVTGCLSAVLLLNDRNTNSGTGNIKYFFSGTLFRFADHVRYDEREIRAEDLAFSAPVVDGSLLGWGLGFPEKGRKQFKVSYLGADSFRLAFRYPVSYPLTEESAYGDQREWDHHEVVKFLIADSRQFSRLPAVFREGYLFSEQTADSSLAFRPHFLSYQKDPAHAAVAMQLTSAENGRSQPVASGNKLFLPAANGNEWEFSVINSFYWNFGGRQFSPAQWHWLIFGSLGFFFLMVFFSALIHPAGRINWVWQILSCLVLLLLTTRFFLYWRYKSFPPYENLDLPSLQQLNSPWNFGIIIFATFLLGILFGADLIRHLVRCAAGVINATGGKLPRRGESESSRRVQKWIHPVLERIKEQPNARKIFWGGWIFLLIVAAILATVTNYNPALCRHMAIALILCYFLFTRVSYSFSPLMAPGAKSWWTLSTDNLADLFISNPVKLLLSISLLGLFFFIDIGFALLFLNFLLFNEAFLFINYSIAGLSAGSRRNAYRFGAGALLLLSLFVVNLVYGPFLFAGLLELPESAYHTGYLFFAALIAVAAGRLLSLPARKKRIVTAIIAAGLFTAAFLFFPKEQIRDKAAMTKYRIDVLIAAPEKVIQKAYGQGHGYEPVIRAAQNQWFINTFISSEHNPAVKQAGFQLLPHAPQNRGARYNAQATDLVTSRFLVAEHGRWSVLLYALLLLLPVTLLASFYKLYPDFTNRINPGYASVITGFSVLNYIFITALLVILAATGRYIFFGQDLPFGSILSKQSVLFPSLLVAGVILLFRKIPLQQYPHPRKLVPGTLVFTGLAILLFLVKPSFNNNKEFGVSELGRQLDGYVQQHLQPLLAEIDSAAATRKLPVEKKDLLFTQHLRDLTGTGLPGEENAFVLSQVQRYVRSGFSRHTDPNSLLYLDLKEGTPRLAVNENYFHVEPPPHLQQRWRGNVYGDTTQYVVTLWDSKKGVAETVTTGNYSLQGSYELSAGLELAFRGKIQEHLYEQLCLVNRTGAMLELQTAAGKRELRVNDSIPLENPGRIYISRPGQDGQWILDSEPEAFMRNYFVNGNRYFYYPLGNDFVWARNFAESIAADHNGALQRDRNVYLSLDAGLTDSLLARMRTMLDSDTAYGRGAEYAVCIADGKGRLLAMPDQIKGMERPDPNDKPAYLEAVGGINTFLSQSDLRKRAGNINLMRLNPGPGSTLKPIVFSAIASQLYMDWDAFAAEGFSGRREYFGGEKVGEYDFEQYNGRIGSVSDYIRYSDNYYHSNLLLLGSYSRQSLQALLVRHFLREKPTGDEHWPWFSYKGERYWLNGFENWPGYAAGKANFGSDSSFISIGLRNNYGIHTARSGKGFDSFAPAFDSLLFANACRRSGFILPEYALFDQKGGGMHMDRPNEVFMSSFRGHVKGSSQVMIPPVKMLDAFGKLVSQNRNYSLTLDPWTSGRGFVPAQVDNGVRYSEFLGVMKGRVFTGMREALFRGTAAGLGARLKNGSPWYYYAKTGTTGDETKKAKSKLLTLIISEKDIADPDFNFRKNRFVIIYFTSQNGPAKQNEEFQAEIIRLVERSPVFLKYMMGPADAGY